MRKINVSNNSYKLEQKNPNKKRKLLRYNTTKRKERRSIELRGWRSWLVGPAAHEGEFDRVHDLGETPRQQREDRPRRRAPTTCGQELTATRCRCSGPCTLTQIEAPPWWGRDKQRRRRERRGRREKDVSFVLLLQPTEEKHEASGRRPD